MPVAQCDPQRATSCFPGSPSRSSHASRPSPVQSANSAGGSALRVCASTLLGGWWWGGARVGEALQSRTAARSMRAAQATKHCEVGCACV